MCIRDSPYAVLGFAGVSNTGATTLYGDAAGSSQAGGSPALTGFGTVTFASGVPHPLGVSTPFTDATTAYTTAQGLSGITELGNTCLGAVAITCTSAVNNLIAGAYKFTDSVTYLDGTLILNAQGLDTGSWNFQIGTALTVEGGTTVEIVNAGAAGPFTGSITWAVGSAATFTGTPSTFLGTIISQAGDTLTNADTIGCGRVISLDASVTLIGDTIAIPDCTVAHTGTGGGTGNTVGIGALPPPIPTPEPSTLVLLGSGVAGLLGRAWMKRVRARRSSPALA